MKVDKQIEIVFEEVIGLLYKDAQSLQTVVKYLRKKYDLEVSRAYEIVREAKVYFGKYMVDADSDLLNECIQILQSNREKAALVDNLKEVRECTKEIAKLQQLYIQKIEHTVKTEQPLFGDIKSDDINE